MSPKKYDEGHNVKRDSEDIQAVIGDTNNHGGVYLFGLSSGAVIVLGTAAYLLSNKENLSGITIYERPFYPIDQPLDPNGVRALSLQLNCQDYPSALISALSLSATIPSWIAWVPSLIKRLLARTLLAADEKWNISGGDGSIPNPNIRTLLPSVNYDFDVVLSAQGHMSELAQFLTRTAGPLGVLLLKGSHSPVYLREAIDRLHRLLTLDPNTSSKTRTKMIDLDGMDHSGPWIKSRGGDPDRVAQAILDFF